MRGEERKERVVIIERAHNIDIEPRTTCCYDGCYDGSCYDRAEFASRYREDFSEGSANYLHNLSTIDDTSPNPLQSFVVFALLPQSRFRSFPFLCFPSGCAIFPANP